MNSNPVLREKGGGSLELCTKRTLPSRSIILPTAKKRRLSTKTTRNRRPSPPQLCSLPRALPTHPLAEANRSCLTATLLYPPYVPLKGCRVEEMHENTLLPHQLKPIMHIFDTTRSAYVSREVLFLTSDDKTTCAKYHVPSSLLLPPGMNVLVPSLKPFQQTYIDLTPCSPTYPQENISAFSR